MQGALIYFEIEISNILSLYMYPHTINEKKKEKKMKSINIVLRSRNICHLFRKLIYLTHQFILMISVLYFAV